MGAVHTTSVHASAAGRPSKVSIQGLHPRSPLCTTTPTILSSSSSAEPSGSRSCLHIHIHMHMHMHGTKRFTLVSPRPLHGLPVYPAKLPVEVHRS